MSIERLKKEALVKIFLISKFKVVVFFAILGVIVFASDTSFAIEKNSIDVVLVMDSSGSMKKTDPLSLRIPAAKLFISLLDKNDRAGVISFSDKSYTISYLTPLDSENNKDSLLKAADKITSDGLYTNLHDALSGGIEVLTRDKKAERSQIIILMSDGMMDVGDPEEDKRLIDKSKNELTSALKDNDIKAFTIAFTEQSDRKLLEKISKRTGGFYNLALTDKDFHLIFTSIFESLKTPEMLPMSKNGFLIDKSIEEVTIIATKGTPDTKIQIDSPDGQSYTYKNKGADIKWFVSTNFDMITVKKPAEGRWEILFSTGENNKAYIITNLKLQTNFDQLYVAYGEPKDIEVWLEKEGSIIKEEAILEKMDFYIELSVPDGKTLKLKPFNKGDGIFQRRIASFTAGDYKLRIVAKGMTFERQKSFVFNVARAKETQEELQFNQSEKKVEKPEEPEEKNLPKDNKTDEVSWKTLIVQFIILNLVLCIVGFVYLKRKDLRNLANLNNLSKIKDLIKRTGKEEKLEDQDEKLETKKVAQVKEPEEEKKEAVQSKQEENKEMGKEEQEIEMKEQGEQGDFKNKIALEEEEPQSEVEQEGEQEKKGDIKAEETQAEPEEEKKKMELERMEEVKEEGLDSA